MRRFSALLAVLFCLACALARAEERSESAESSESYSFDVSTVAPKALSTGGYVELRAGWLWLDHDALLFRTAFFDRGEPERAQWLARLQLEGSYQRQPVSLYLRTNSDLVSEDGSWSHLTTLHEGYARWTRDRSLSFDVGKRVLRWGTGYSWSPVGFVERPKNPDEPDLPREGFFIVAADRVQSLPGALQTLGATVVVVPCSDALSRDFGRKTGVNVAAKLYGLYQGTDLDVMTLVGPSQPTRYGMDFARNLRTNLEVHGEYAYAPVEERAVPTTDGKVLVSQRPIHRALLGVRYLTADDVTYIVEYQYNGRGLSASEAATFYRFIENADALYRQSGDDSLLLLGRRMSRSLFSARPLGRRYLYLRVSQKEPSDILYFTPAVTLQCNLEDRSCSLAPEAVYTGFADVELRARLFLLFGGERTEFGEKATRCRFELTAKRYF